MGHTVCVEFRIREPEFRIQKTLIVTDYRCLQLSSFRRNRKTIRATLLNRDSCIFFQSPYGL
jgi:hypothetical protein